MTEIKIAPAEIQPLLGLDQDQLYTLLAPPAATADLNHPGALIARGKTIFVDLIQQSRTAVCKAYHANKDVVGDSVQLVSVVAAAMLDATGLVKNTVLPAAVLVVKIGLNAICQGVGEQSNAGG